MKIHKTTLPQESLLNSLPMTYDYVDSFQGIVHESKYKYTAIDTGKAFFMSAPQWVESLFVWRNKIVSVFGLKTDGNQTDRAKQLENFKCQPGDQLGLFKVFATTEHEVILGEDDKHLNFRVSLLLQEPAHDSNKKYLIISTTVTFNHWFGRLYFIPVRLFHQRIVPVMLKRIIQALEAKNT